FRKKREEAAAANMAAATQEDSADVDVGLQPAHRPSEEEEERLRAKALMPKKHKRLLQRIEAAEAKREAANKRLKRKAEAASS
ncbi:unnamed protein product, partial [Symbiodinium necroappetens]